MTKKVARGSYSEKNDLQKMVETLAHQSDAAIYLLLEQSRYILLMR
jgi:hypothetical protein